jgi:hypothetical protein
VRLCRIMQIVDSLWFGQRVKTKPNPSPELVFAVADSHLFPIVSCNPSIGSCSSRTVAEDIARDLSRIFYLELPRTRNSLDRSLGT